MDKPTPSAAAVETASIAELTDMKNAQGTASSSKASQLSRCRKLDSANNLKRNDPFQFGSRYLTKEDDVYEFNAWDHVETDDAFKEYTEQQLEMQRQAPVSDFDKSRFNSNPQKWWNLFYQNNTSNFFKDRKWLRQEFPILETVTTEDAGPQVILEIGAGAGNTAFPILANNKNPQLRIHACDFSKKAVEIMRKHENYTCDQIQADVWDVAGPDLPPGLQEGSVDVAILIFIFSALSPTEWTSAMCNVHRLVRPGGTVLFRDYGRGDLAQVRFRKGRYLEENFYIRGDGTRVYFFDKDELADIWSGKSNEPERQYDSPRFYINHLAVDRRLIVNRALQKKMYRCWLQGQFTKG